MKEGRVRSFERTFRQACGAAEQTGRNQCVDCPPGCHAEFFAAQATVSAEFRGATWLRKWASYNGGVRVEVTDEHARERGQR